jgi:hypothetical protein
MGYRTCRWPAARRGEHSTSVSFVGHAVTVHQWTYGGCVAVVLRQGARWTCVGNSGPILSHRCGRADQ